MKAFSSLRVPLAGSHLVEASAGTGKTHAIATLMLRLLLSGLRIEQIVVLTFSNAATEELRARIRERLHEAIEVFSGGESEDKEILALLAENEAQVESARARLSLALRNVDQSAVFTINGFCQRVLQEHAFDSGVRLDAELKGDLSELYQQVVSEFWFEVAETGSLEIANLLRTSIRPEHWISLAKLAVERPGLALLPEFAEVSYQVDDLRASFATAKALWDREAMEALLLNHHALNRYTPYYLLPWLEQADEFFNGAGPPLFEVPGNLFRLTHPLMLTKLAKGKTEADLPQHPFIDAAGVVVAAAEAFQAAGEQARMMLDLRFIDFVRARWPQCMRRAGWLSYGDQIHLLDAALAGPGGDALAHAVQSRFHVALIDEFQDTDRAQYRIFQRFWSKSTLFLIGDPKQAIYGFRGAEIFAYLHAASQVPAGARHTMAVNWRSDPSLIRAVHAVFDSVSEPFLLDRLDFPEVQAREGAADLFEAEGEVSPAVLEVLFVSQAKKTTAKRTTDGIAIGVAREIGQLLASGSRIDGERVLAKDVAVLVRSNPQALVVRDALRAEGVHAVVRGQQSVFEEGQEVADALRCVLAAALEPRRESLLRGALLTLFHGMSANDIDALKGDDEQWGAWVERFTAYRRMWIDKGLTRMLKAVVDEGNVDARLLKRADGERQLTNLRHLTELLHGAERQQHLGPNAVIEWFDAQRCAKNTRAGEDTQLRLERDDEAVTILTLHRSKGLQFPVVYLPFCWKGAPTGNKQALFHDPENDYRATLDLAGGDMELERTAREQLAEDLRLLYVGLTRAKHRCSIVWGSLKGHETSAISYLLRLQPSHPIQGVADLRQLYKGVEEPGLQARLAEKFAKLGETVAVRPLPMDLSLGQGSAGHQAPSERSAREVASRVTRWWRVTSFSGLASAGQRSQTDDQRERDEELLAAPTPAVVSESGEPALLAEFPGGTKAGNFFHWVLEHIDFSDLSDAALRIQVERGLMQFGFSVSDWTEQVTLAIRSIMTTPLGEGDEAFSLAEADGCLPELAFHLPLGDVTGDQVTVSRMANVLRAFPSEQLLPRYADALERLGGAPVEGLLKGYIDLVMRKNDRWYLADYKSNYLGESMNDYEASRLPAAMAHGHYYLQYHLYCVALHRYLERRLAGYDYDTHFGGVHYLFLRGMRPETGHRHGVFFERPPKARIVALSGVLGGGAGGGK